MADIGNISLFLALVASLYAAFAFIFGVRGGHQSLIESAKNSLLAVCGLVSISVVVLLYALITHNFQIEYVASSGEVAHLNCFEAGFGWVYAEEAVLGTSPRNTEGEEALPPPLPDSVQLGGGHPRDCRDGMVSELLSFPNSQSSQR